LGQNSRGSARAVSRALGECREAQLVEAAKKEGKIVLYGTTNIAVMQQLLDQFKKKYSFLQIDNYRATTNRVFTRIQAEARSGAHAVDVIEISPDSAFKLKARSFA
jgi:iron(III) transport system substrate-binding protein